MKFSLRGDKGLQKRLEQLSRKTLVYSVNRSITEIADRAGQKYTNRQYGQGWTPYDPKNKSTVHLITSLSMKKASRDKRAKGSVGYTMHYAPHVEFGHRTRNGGYVSGQRYLYRNHLKQRPKLIAYAKKEIEK